MLDETKEALEALCKFHDDVRKEWDYLGLHILGHIVHFPPITLGAGIEGFTEDYAIIELDGSKIEKTFRGNVYNLPWYVLIYLASKIIYIV